MQEFIMDYIPVLSLHAVWVLGKHVFLICRSLDQKDLHLGMEKKKKDLTRVHGIWVGTQWLHANFALFARGTSMSEVPLACGIIRPPLLCYWTPSENLIWFHCPAPLNIRKMWAEVTFVRSSCKIKEPVHNTSVFLYTTLTPGINSVSALIMWVLERVDTNRVPANLYKI